MPLRTANSDDPLPYLLALDAVSTQLSSTLVDFNPRSLNGYYLVTDLYIVSELQNATF